MQLFHEVAALDGLVDQTFHLVQAAVDDAAGNERLFDPAAEHPLAHGGAGIKALCYADQIAVVFFKDFFHQKIDFDALKAIYQNYHHLLSFYYHIEGHPYSVINNGDFYENRTEINSIDELENKDITGVSVYADTDEKAKAICAELNEKYPLVNVFQNNSWLDIVDKNISKGISALKLKELTKADIMCGIGDSYNDIELLKAADISFCFDYSPIEVKNEADYIVDSVCEAIKIILQAEQGL